MFEFDKEIVDALLQENTGFKRLYDKYINLKQEVNHANSGDLAIPDMQLEEKKKEKLFLKDQLTEYIEDYRQDNAA